MIDHLQTKPGGYIELSFRERVDVSLPSFLDPPDQEISQAAARGIVRRFYTAVRGERRRQSRLKLVSSSNATDPAP